jgi:glutaredoxin 3
MAERLLTARGATDIDKVLVDVAPERRAEMIERCGRTTVPQIFIGDTHVGGYTDLANLDRQGRLDELLARP